MRITTNNIDFELPSNFEAELTRNNVLLTDAGEQTAPITLPGSPHNLRLIGHSDRIDNYYKPLTDLDVVVSDGLFNRPCNLGIHTANAVDGISCTIYLGTGDFYSRIGNTRLNWIGWPVIKSPTFDSQTLAQRVQYLIDLLKAQYTTPTNISEFGIRPVATTQEYTWKKPDNSNVKGILILNGFEKYQSTLDLSQAEYIEKFEGEYTQHMVVGEDTITITTGYGMTPFLKIRYMIEFIFQSFGYTTDLSALVSLTPNFEHNTLLLNNVADAIYSGTLYYKQLVPDITIKEFLAEINKEFSGTFNVNEATKVATFYRYQDQLNAASDIDLTQYSCSLPKVGIPEFKTIQLNETISTKSETSETKEKIEIIEFDFAKTVDVIDEYKTNIDTYVSSIQLSIVTISEIVHLNSTIVVNGVSTTENINTSTLMKLIYAKNEWQEISVYRVNNGYVSVYYRVSTPPFYNDFLDEYSDYIATPLLVEEMFYLEYKAFRLNSNIPLEVEMDIPPVILEKMNLQTPKLLNGQKVMIESIVQILGRKGTQKVKFRTLRGYIDRE